MSATILLQAALWIWFLGCTATENSSLVDENRVSAEE